MKKITFLILVMFVALSWGASLEAHEDKDMGMMGGEKKMGGMMGMPMMQKSVVATSDGGVVVVAGHKITKYDKDLNVVKEVEMKMDEGMEKKMKEMMAKCPMMGEGSSGEEPAPASEHESRH